MIHIHVGSSPESIIQLPYWVPMTTIVQLCKDAEHSFKRTTVAWQDGRIIADADGAVEEEGLSSYERQCGGAAAGYPN